MREPAEVGDTGSKARAALRLVRRKAEGADAVTAGTHHEPKPGAAARASNVRDVLRREWRLTVAGLMFVFGIAFVLLGWYGAAYTNIVSEQIPYVISGGLLGLGLMIVAGIMASAAIRDREAALLRREIARAVASAGSSPASIAPARAAGATPSASSVFSVPGGRSFHMAGCPIIEGKDGVTELGPPHARAQGLEPCKLCTD